MAIRTTPATLPAVILAAVLAYAPMQTVQAEQRWAVGSGLGFTTGTVDDTVLTVGVNLDYFLARNFSFGPMMLITPAGDLFQISLAGVGRLHFRMNNGLSLVPFAGFGLTHAVLIEEPARAVLTATTPAGTSRSVFRWNIRSFVTLHLRPP
jgi:hypothetical protein